MSEFDMKFEMNEWDRQNGQTTINVDKVISYYKDTGKSSVVVVYDEKCREYFIEKLIHAGKTRGVNVLYTETKQFMYGGVADFLIFNPENFDICDMNLYTGSGNKIDDTGYYNVFINEMFEMAGKLAGLGVIGISKMKRNGIICDLKFSIEDKIMECAVNKIFGHYGELDILANYKKTKDILKFMLSDFYVLSHTKTIKDVPKYNERSKVMHFLKIPSKGKFIILNVNVEAFTHNGHIQVNVIDESGNDTIITVHPEHDNYSILVKEWE